MKDSAPLFQVGDVVFVVDTDASLAEIDRKYGVVEGMSETSDGSWYYAVGVYCDDDLENRTDGYMIYERNLTATGRRKVDQEPRISIRVSDTGDVQ